MCAAMTAVWWLALLYNRVTLWKTPKSKVSALRALSDVSALFPTIILRKPTAEAIMTSSGPAKIIVISNFVLSQQQAVTDTEKPGHFQIYNFHLFFTVKNVFEIIAVAVFEIWYHRASR